MRDKNLIEYTNFLVSLLLILSKANESEIYFFVDAGDSSLGKLFKRKRRRPVTSGATGGTDDGQFQY